jgi:hypothetical protein
MAVIVHQPTPRTISFDPLPLYYLAKLDGVYSTDASSCALCAKNEPIEKVWI